ncbi:NADP-dependent oxidoreductase domain-containing protein [Mycena polygramma]|nr:NADP-dependent oxidoreductase domain-containing protein [Mycena polygramma]
MSTENKSSIKLSTGALIPAIGLGGAPDGFNPEAIADSDFLTAFKAGYRHFDTAYIYRTEPYLGAALRASGVPREEMVAPPYLMHWPITAEYANGYDGPATFQELLEDLKVVDTPSFNDTRAEMERLHASGRAKAIGVSNFSIKTLKQLFKTAKIVPAVNQVEMHPYLAQPELLEYCRAKGIVVVAYTPSGHETVRNDPTIVALAEKYCVSATQVILAWHRARGLPWYPRAPMWSARSKISSHRRGQDSRKRDEREIGVVETVQRVGAIPNDLGVSFSRSRRLVAQNGTLCRIPPKDILQVKSKCIDSNSEVMALPGGAWIPGCPRSENPTRWKWLVVADGFLRTNNTAAFQMTRKVAATGGISEQILIKEEERATTATIVKLRHGLTGHDGTWTAHPYRADHAPIFDKHMLRSNYVSPHPSPPRRYRANMVSSSPRSFSRQHAQSTPRRRHYELVNPDPNPGSKNHPSLQSSQLATLEYTVVSTLLKSGLERGEVDRARARLEKTALPRLNKVGACLSRDRQSSVSTLKSGVRKNPKTQCGGTVAVFQESGCNIL